MKRLLFCFLLFFFVKIIVAQPNLDEYDFMKEEMHLLFKLDTTQPFENKISYYILARNPFETEYDTITLKPALPFATSESDFMEETVQVQVSPIGMVNIVRKLRGDSKDCNRVKDNEHIYIASYHFPAIYETLRIKRLKPEAKKRANKNFSERTEEEVKIISKRVYSAQSYYLKEIAHPDEAEHSHRVIPLKKGTYEPYSYISCCLKASTFRIKDIQQALSDKDYPNTVDGVLGSETKAALIQFQKDNNLPQGRLDIETLKLLGVY